MLKAEFTPEQIEEFIRLKATGHGSREISKLYNVSHTTICLHLKTPESQAKLQVWREIIKRTLLQSTAEGLAAGAAELMQKCITGGDAKGTDAASRALLNLEKTSASAAGEGRKVEVSGPEGQPLQIDVRAILAQLAQSE